MFNKQNLWYYLTALLGRNTLNVTGEYEITPFYTFTYPLIKGYGNETKALEFHKVRILPE